MLKGTWEDFRRASASLAMAAERLAKIGDMTASSDLFARAAEIEQAGIWCLGPDDKRGMSALSAVSLWLRSGDNENARRLALVVLSAPDIPEWVMEALRDVVAKIAEKEGT